MSLSEKIIDEVKKHPFLFNKKDPHYKNIIKKTKIWHEIGQKFNLTDEECSRKWRSLRDRYTRELKAFQSESQTGKESMQLETYKWDLFESMQFLKDHCEPNKKTVTNYKSCDSPETKKNVLDDNIIDTIAEDQRKTIPSSSSSVASESSQSHSLRSSKIPQKRKMLDEVNTSFVEAAACFKEMCNNVNHNKAKPSEDQGFAETVSAFIGAIENEQAKRNAKSSVLKYLADCVSEQYE